MKEQEVLDKNYSSQNYITERLECKSLDGRLIDIASIRQAEVLVQKAKLIESS